MPQPPFARYDEIRAIFDTEPHDTDPPLTDPHLTDPPLDPLATGEDFGRIEEDFSRFLDQSLHPRGRDSLDDLLAGADPPRDGVAVDVGCGRGRDVVTLATRFGLQVRGIDPSPDNVERARSRAAAEGLTDRTEFHLGRAEDLPLPDASVDVLWCKEVITFTDLDVAMREFHRVMRPGAVGLIYQVLTGPAMSDADARWLTAQEMGFGAASSLRPGEVHDALRAAGFEVVQRVDYGSEWGEAADEHDGSAGRRLLHAARLLRAPQIYIDHYGTSNYRIMLADCLWHVYRMIGKLWGVAFLIRRHNSR